MGNKKILAGILKFKTPISVLLFMAAFFSFYNLFLVDRALEDLRFSLERTAMAYCIEDIDGIDLVMTKSLAEDMPYVKLNTRNIATLEYVQRIITAGKDFRQLDNAKVALKSIIAKEEGRRGPVLSILDKINRPLRRDIAKLAHIYSIIVKPPKLVVSPLDAQNKLIEKIAALKMEKDLAKAALAYKEIIERYPDNEKLPLVMLRLASTYQKLGQNDKAINGYKEIARKYPLRQEAGIATALLSGLYEKDRLLKEVDSLVLRYKKLSKANVGDRQQIAYDIGRYYTRLLNLDDAIKFFSRAFDIDPSSDVAIKSQLAISWLYKQKNNFEKSEAALGKIIELRPEAGFANDIYLQIVDTYYYQGKFEQSIELLKKLVEAYRREDSELAGLCLFQIGASYMYDLNDPEKAEEIFRQLAKEFPKSSYAKFMLPQTSAGMFITLLVPKATRILTWRTLGLVCISGYGGGLCEFRASTREDGFNLAFNDWLRKELPKRVANIYVDIKGQKTEFTKDRAVSQGLITMGRFKVEGKADWKFVISKGKMLNLRVLKAFLEKLPLPPILINRALMGMEQIIEKNIPVEIKNISMNQGDIIVEGVGSRNMLDRVKNVTKILFETDFEIEEIADPIEAAKAAVFFKEKFPEEGFASIRKNDDEDLFLDFFTRVSMFLTFRILETVKNSKFDYKRSIRAFGQLIVSRENFKVVLKKDDIRTELSRYIECEFPWLVGDYFLIDIKGVDLDFNDNGEIDFNINVNLGLGGLSEKPSSLKVSGTMVFEIDRESGIPKWAFKKLTLNNMPFSVEKLNIVAKRCFNILKDDRIPITLEEIRPYKDGIVFKGRGARDFTGRLFNASHLFSLLRIRQADLEIAGIRRLKPSGKADEKVAAKPGEK